jgi:predicted nucleotidyltransferase/predicted transcriptional regulator
MRQQKYLEQVFGNKGSISVLRTLIRHKGRIFTIRRLAEDAGISHTEAAATVQDLEKAGIILVQPVGRSHQISLNEKSYILNKIVEPAFAAEQDSFSKVISILKNNLKSNAIISAAVFGSMAKGKEKEDSDIDLLIISDNHDDAILIASKIAESMFLEFHKKVSHIVLTQKQIRKKKNSDLVRSILKDHILVAGRKLEDVIR